MAIETKEKTIGAHVYQVSQLDAVSGRKAFVRLGNALGPAFKASAKGDELGALLGALKESDMDYFCDLFAGKTSVTGGEYGDKSPNLAKIFPVHFAGEYFEMVEWLLFCVEANFSSFFANAGALIATLPGQTAKPVPVKSDSPVT